MKETTTLVEWISKDNKLISGMQSKDWTEPMQLPPDVGEYVFVTLIVDGEIYNSLAKWPVAVGSQRLLYSWNGKVYSL